MSHKECRQWPPHPRSRLLVTIHVARPPLAGCSVSRGGSSNHPVFPLSQRVAPVPPALLAIAVVMGDFSLLNLLRSGAPGSPSAAVSSERPREDGHVIQEGRPGGPSVSSERGRRGALASRGHNVPTRVSPSSPGAAGVQVAPGPAAPLGSVLAAGGSRRPSDSCPPPEHPSG